MITDKSRYGHDAVLDLNCSDSVQVLRTEPMTLTEQEREIVRAYLGIMLLEKSYIGANGHLILALSDGREVDLGSARGLPGATPYIGGNGNWFVDGRDTLTPARGPQGFIPYVGENRNWYINGVDTGVYAGGVDGDIPYIGDDGNWHVGDTDTGIRAQGPQGIQGIQGTQGIQGIQGDTPYIGENGNWWIAGTDLKIAAQGPRGIQGIQGIQGPKGDVPQIGENGNWTVGGTDTGVHAQGPKGDRGDGVPALEAANNARFLRNDGTWQTVTPANIGAAPASHNQSASTITAGTFAGQVAANASGQAPSASCLRNSKFSFDESDVPTVEGETVWYLK